MSLARDLVALERCQVSYTRTAYASILRRCEVLKEGKRVHAHIRKWSDDRNTYLGNFLVQMYGKCGSLQDAKRAFERLRQPNVFSWNFMLVAFAENGEIHDARKLFSLIPKRDVVSWTAMVTSYSQSQSLEEAVDLFDSMPERNVVSWNAMVAAYATHGHSRRSIGAFRQMLVEGFQPNQVTFICALEACNHLTEGRLIHTVILANLSSLTSQLETAILSMYGRCGSVSEARLVFEACSHEDLVSWNSLVCAYGNNGFMKEGVKVCRAMTLEGFDPVEMTFSSILAACSHTGTIHEAREMFVTMQVDYGLCPNIFHYKCMVDVLARAGHLDDARNIVDEMPFEPDAWTWRCLVAGSTIHEG